MTIFIGINPPPYTVKFNASALFKATDLAKHHTYSIVFNNQSTTVGIPSIQPIPFLFSITTLLTGFK
jgi:hypothetical protein